MRLLIVTQYFWPENFRVNDLVKEMVKRGHSVTVLTGYPNYPDGKIFKEFLQAPDNFSNLDGAEIIRTPLVPRGNGAFRLLLNYLCFAVSASIWGAWKLRRRQFDVIFTPQLSPVSLALPAVLLRFLKRIPHVMWVLDLWPDTLEATGTLRSKKMLGLVGKLVGFIYFRTDLILAQSKSFVPQIKKLAKKNAHVEYFPSWAEAIFDEQDVLPAAEIAAKEPMDFNIMFAGNIGDAQDFPAILKAAELLKEQKHIRFLIVGDGRLASWVSQEIVRRDLTGSVKLLGRYPLERMPAFFKHADALLVSLKAEPIFSMTIPGKLQSYLAAGIPILAMLDGEGAEVLRNNDAGYVCAAGDAPGLAAMILKMTSLNRSEQEKLGAKAKALGSSEFDRTQLMLRLEQRFNEVEYLA